MSDTKYLVAARKYRPQRFADVVAQEHVTETLRNAIKMDRLAHAYLFSGPRGVGKTTVARILAKAINCEVPIDQRPEAEPCEECPSCLSFSEGRSLNVIEIDAASNNKVDDVRELRDTVRIPPQGARKKVYIVDEVHMLSNAAFNAFLKTLEEPPPYALFIFATTEPRKVIPTILSRCQRFDFKRIPVDETVTRLREIAERENISVDDGSLMLIARKGDGALRDALSVFDQAVSLCGSTIEYSSLTQALRVVDDDLYFTATDNVLAGSSAGMLDLVERIVSEGYDLQEFLAGLAGHIRNLLVAVSTGETSLIEATDAMRKRYSNHGAEFDEHQLLRLLMILARTEETIGRSSQPRLAAELGLLKMAASLNAIDLRKALDRVDQLEKKITSPASAPQTAAPAQPTAFAQPPATEKAAPASKKPVITEPKQEKVQEPKPAKSPAEQPVAAADEAATTAENPKQEPAPSTAKTTREKSTVPASDAEESAAPAAPGLFGPPALSRKKNGPRKSDPRPSTIEGSLAVAAEPRPAIPESIESLWLKYVSTIKSIRIHVGSLLQHGAPIEVRDATVVVAIPDEFHRRLLDNQHDFLLKHLNSASEVAYDRIDFVVKEINRDPAESGEPDEFDPYEYMKRKRKESPIVKAIFEDFGGELVW